MYRIKEDTTERSRQERKIPVVALDWGRIKSQAKEFFGVSSVHNEESLQISHPGNILAKLILGMINWIK